MTVPDFSPLASLYAQARPRYPQELFAFLASLVERRHQAWDCATGNGQAALGLVDHFTHVVATDVSMAQIQQAAAHARIDYLVGRSEASALATDTIDLVTVAAAIHWFDLERFVAEVERVLRRGGVLAAWTYHVGRIDPPLDVVFARFYREVIASYFAPAVKAVDERYETLRLPGTRIEAEDFWMSARWTLDQMLAFIRSWSATERYIQERGEDPSALIIEELERIWGERDRILAVRWPLHLRIVRL